jgi:phosphoribosylglycinamide formyltransferase 1
MSNKLLTAGAEWKFSYDFRVERLGSLISGGGTTMQEIIRASQSGDIPGLEVACVIASRPDAGGIDKARRLGIPERDIIVIDSRAFRADRAAFGERIISVLADRGVTVVTQNGWLPLTPESVIRAYEGNIFNQHPGPPEAFGGKGMMGRAVHAAVLEFQRLTGRIFDTWVVGHRVAAGLDEGAVVKRAKVAVEPGDTAESLQARALPAEHRVQVELLRDFVRGELQALAPETLVFPGEEPLLEEAKRIARERFPRG